MHRHPLRRAHKYDDLRTLNKRQDRREPSIDTSRSTEKAREDKHAIVEVFASQVGLPDRVVDRAQNLLLGVDNLSTIGSNAESAIETVALTTLAIAHRELFGEVEWSLRRKIPPKDEARRGRLLVETEALDRLLTAVDRTLDLDETVDRATIRATYEKGFADYPSPFPEDMRGMGGS